jgi:hypothetical protein
MHCLPLANRNVPRKVPEQGHGFRILGDILAAKGDAIKAEELHSLARAQYRSLALQLRILLISESMGHHDSEIMDDRGIDRDDA